MEQKIEAKLKDLNLDYDPDDVKKLASKLEYLKNNNLEKMSNRLLEQNKATKFLQTLTEVNFAFQLLNNLLDKKLNFKVEYEPDVGTRPIDLVVGYNNKKYNIQIKYLSSSVRTNKQNKIVAEIKRQSNAIEANRGFTLHVSQTFTMKNVKNLMEFIKANLSKKDGEGFVFEDSAEAIAHIEFQTPKNKVRKHLVLCGFVISGAQEITGETKEQVKAALQNACGAFNKNNSVNEVNIIVSEITSDRRESIDFAEALYGTEFCTFNGKLKTHRDNDGLFLQEDFSNKVAAVVVVHRKDNSLISDYEKVICVNLNHDYIQSITDLIHDKIIERYTWIENSFFN